MAEEEIEAELSDSEVESAEQTGQEDPSPNLPTDYKTLAQGFLSPRHRRLCQLAASGQSNQAICAELGYSDSRMSILLKNPFIAAEVTRLQERIFEETIGSRLKSFAEPALNNIQMILTDRTNRVKISERMALSQWVIEKLDGKATQKIEAGENMLAALMDKLDASKTARTVHITNNFGPDALAVSARPVEEMKQIEMKSEEKDEEGLLDDWVVEFTDKA